MEPSFVSPKALAKQTGLSVGAIYQRIRRGEIEALRTQAPTVKRDGRLSSTSILIPREEAERFLASLVPTRPPEPTPQRTGVDVLLGRLSELREYLDPSDLAEAVAAAEARQGRGGGNG